MLHRVIASGKEALSEPAGAGAEAPLMPARREERERSEVRVRGILDDVSGPAPAALVINVLDGE